MTIDPASLASMLEVMAAALRAMPAGSVPPAVAAMVGQAAAPARTLGEWLDLHERQLQDKGYKAQTLKNRRSVLAHVRRLWGDRPIASIKPLDVSAGLKTFPASRSSTSRRVLAELRDAYTEAVANGWAEHNPAALIKPPRHRVIRARLRFETWLAMRELSQASPQRWVESMLLLALVTGQRRADLAKMRFDDIVVDDAGVQVLRVEQQKEAGKGYGARLEIPLDLRLEAIGMSVRDVIEHCRHSAKPGPTLLRKAGGGPIEQSSLSQRFHDHISTVLGEQAHKRHEWPSLHEVRSLSARLYEAEGVDTQALLGHKHREMTEEYIDDRGLSAKTWKRVPMPASHTERQPTGTTP